MQLPFRDAAVDVCYSSNVLEHVPDPWRMAEEMLRVTRPGGLVFLSYTDWYGPWGGHETAPWHYLGGRQARRRYAARTATSPRTSTASRCSRSRSRDGLRWARSQQDADVVAPDSRATTRGGAGGCCASRSCERW